jgi:hypothetical protein
LYFFASSNPGKGYFWLSIYALAPHFIVASRLIILHQMAGILPFMALQVSH